MVRAIPNNPWRLTDFLERVRPGIAVSAALHIGLFIALAYFLAFRPQLQVPARRRRTKFSAILRYPSRQPPKPVIDAQLDLPPGTNAGRSKGSIPQSGRLSIPTE